MFWKASLRPRSSSQVRRSLFFALWIRVTPCHHSTRWRSVAVLQLLSRQTAVFFPLLIPKHISSLCFFLHAFQPRIFSASSDLATCGWILKPELGILFVTPSGWAVWLPMIGQDVGFIFQSFLYVETNIMKYCIIINYSQVTMHPLAEQSGGRYYQLNSIND